MSKSPTSPKRKDRFVVANPLSFYEALDKCVEGKKVSRHAWGDLTEYIFIQNDRLMIHRNNEEFILEVSVGDIISNDWFIL